MVILVDTNIVLDVMLKGENRIILYLAALI